MDGKLYMLTKIVQHNENTLTLERNNVTLCLLNKSNEEVAKMAKTRNYEEIAKNVIEYIGGASNVTFCTHCMTRLRFVVKDREVVKTDKIKELDVSGCVWVEDQLQIIIGTDVNKLYPIVCKIGNFEEKKAVEENLDKDIAKADTPSEKKSWKQIPGAALKAMGECIMPLIPGFIAYGMFASIVAIFGPSGLGLMSEDSGIYILCNTLVSAYMYFLPIFITVSSAKRFKCTTILSLLAVGAMMYPDFIAMITGSTFSLFGITPMAVSLEGQMIPIILMCWIQGYIEKLFDKILPSSLNLPFKGLLTLIIILPLTILVLTPLGTFVGTGISTAINALYGLCGPLVTLILGFLYLILIIPGMHLPVVSAFLMGFFITGMDYVIMPIMFPLCYISSATDIAIFFRAKDKRDKELATTGATAMILGGVVEPALYSLYLIYPRTLIACCAGMGVCGLLMGIFGVAGYAFTSFNFLAITSFAPGGIDNLVKACIAIGVGMIVSFVLVMVMGLGKKKEQ
jgi:PTS system beta-glucosides-specific IIC component